MAVVALALFFGTPTGERLAFEQLRGWLLGRFELAIDAETIDVQWRARQLEVEGLVIGVAGESAFLRLGRAELGWQTWRQLLASPTRVDTVVLTAVELDLDAPLPGGSGEGDGGGGGRELPLALGHVELTDAKIGQRFRPVRGWLESWTLEVGSLVGRLEAGRVEAGIEEGVLVLGSVDDGPVALELAARRLEGALRGPFVVEGLVAKGDGLALLAEGEVVASRSGGLTAHIELDAEPARLLPRLASGAGVARLRGELALPFDAADGVPYLGATADLAVELEAFPAELLSPWLPPELFDGLAMGETRLDVEADVRTDPSAGASPHGRAELTWRHVDETWLVLDARLDTSAAGEAAKPIELRGDLLPSAAGQRSLGVALHLGDDLSSATLSGGRLELDEADLGVALVGYARRWPLLGRALAPVLSPLGAATATEGGDAPSPLGGRLEGWLEVEGNPIDPELDAAFSWFPVALEGTRSESGGVTAERVEIELAGRPAEGRGELGLRLLDFDLARLPPWVEGLDTLGGRLELDARLAGSLDQGIDWAEALLEVRGVEVRGVDDRDVEDMPGIGGVRYGRLDARLVEKVLSARVELEALPGEDGPRQAPAQLVADIQTDWELPIRRLDLDWRAEDLLPRLDAFTGRAALRQGALVVEEGLLEVSGVAGTASRSDPSTAIAFQGRLPLSSLASVVDPTLFDGWLGEQLVVAGGPLEAEASAELAELVALATDAGLELPALVEEPCGRLEAALQLDPERPEAARGRLVVDALTALVADRPLTATSPLRLSLGEGLLRLEETVFELPGGSLEILGEARLEAGDGPDRLASTRFGAFDLRAWGHLPAAFLEPYVSGLSAEGSFAIDGRLEGSAEAPIFELSASGEEVVATLVEPYRTVVEGPEVALRWADDRLEITRLTARLNDGQALARGSWTPVADTGGDLALEGLFDSVRYRLDQGLAVLASGNFDLRWPAEGSAEVGANVLVERAVIRRDIPLARELMGQLFGPGEIPGLEEPSDDEIRLDLSIATVDGLRIRNNLADLRATWNPITVRGTISQPVISGGVDVESGGLISLYGQVLRLDHAQLTFPGLPGVSPELDLQTTSSIEDPTVGQGRPDLFTGSGAQGESSGLDRALATGFATFAGERLSDLASPMLGRGTSISVRPVLIFGESNPEARLAVRRDVSSTLALILAVNLSDTQRRTYLVDLHDFRFARDFEAQLFTNEGEEAGVTLQQTRDFGGGPAPDSGDRRLRHLVFDVPPGFETRLLRRAVRLDEGDALAEGVDFDTEIDVAEALERVGHPAARVVVVERAVVEEGKGESRSDLLVRVEPGPRAEVSFEGDVPPRALAGSIRQLYDPVLDDATVREEISRRTREIFLGLGHLDPEVTVVIDRQVVASADAEGGGAAAGPGGGQALHRVTVHTTAGPRRKLGAPRFEGLAQEVADDLAARVSTQLERIELAQGGETARRRLLAALREMGFPEARIVDIGLEDDMPRVVLDPGRPRHLASFSVSGLEGEAAAAVEPPVFEVGEVLRTDRLVRAVVDLESSLREKGWAAARVTPWVEPRVIEPESGSLEGHALGYAALGYDVELKVATGPRRRLGEVEVSGHRATRPSWIERLAELDEGEVLPPRDLVDARRRLLASGLFTRVQVLAAEVAEAGEGADTETGADTDTVTGADVLTDAVTDVRLEVEEKPRFRLAGGLRWTTEDGLSTVFDLLDRNFTGRASAIGLRARYGDKDRAARLYGVIPRIFASRYDLELFAEVADDTAGERFELSAQISRRLSRRLRWRLYGRYRSVEAALVQADGTVTDAEIPFLGSQLIYGEQAPSDLAPEGTFWSLDLSASDSRLGSPQRFVRFFGQLHHHRPLGGPRGRHGLAEPFAHGPVWSQSLRVGIADAFDETLLRDLRFFTGGDLSVRGYETDRLGPLAPGDDGELEPLGGEALLVMNQELRFALWGAFSGLVFVDVGNVWSDVSDLGSDLAWSAGVGLRFSSPIGLLRLDVGFPLDRREGDDTFELGLGFGHAF